MRFPTIDILTSVVQMSLCNLFLSLETPKGVQSVAYQLSNTQATSKAADQTAPMRRLI